MAKTKNKANLIKKTKRKDKTNSLGEREQHDGHVVSEFNLQQFGYFLKFFFQVGFLYNCYDYIWIIWNAKEYVQTY